MKMKMTASDDGNNDEGVEMDERMADWNEDR